MSEPQDNLSLLPPAAECRTCLFFHALGQDATSGYCRRNPPVFAGADLLGLWPEVEDSDGCGEYRKHP